jgi:hypothetical protein
MRVRSVAQAPNSAVLDQNRRQRARGTPADSQVSLERKVAEHRNDATLRRFGLLN